MIQIPAKFQPRQNREYPNGNRHQFEEWFFDNYEGSKKRTYLPVFWTNYYCQNDYGKDKKALAELQRFIDSLTKKKYFTVIQYDDGILNDISWLDIKVFAMSGERIDYPLPLICWPTPVKQQSKTIFCNFIGRPTHWIRTEILNSGNLKGQGWFVTDYKHRKQDYMDIMSKSVFTLCPRGYGRTSFRIQEAIECGSIPVYIGDRFIIPHKVDFDTYGVTVTPDRISSLREILTSISPEEIERKQKLLPEVFEEYYSYGGVKRLIMKNL